MATPTKVYGEEAWVRIQQKTFQKWMNSYMSRRGLAIADLVKDLEDGVKLIQFFEIISNESLGKFDKNPKMRIQKAQNLEVVFKFVQKKGIKLTNLGPTDILDGNLKLILGFIWTIISKFSIDDITEEQLTAKEALLLWCKKKTKGYRDCNIDNFHFSWKDGMAFCALIHAHRPDLIPYDTLSKANAAENLQLAFDVAEKLGIPPLLDVADIVDTPKPDERSIMTYVAQFYHLFASSRKQEIAGRRVGRLVDLTQSNDQLKHDYIENATKFVKWAKEKSPAFDDRSTQDTLEDIQHKAKDMKDYKGKEKVDKAADKTQLEGLFNSIAMKLRSNNRPAFNPPEGLDLKNINDLWNKVGDSEKSRNDWIAKELARHNLLLNLLKRWEVKAANMESWTASKEEFLKTNESVETLKEAQSKLKIAEAFSEEYSASKNRLKQLHELADEITALFVDKSKADAIHERKDKINAGWEGLQGLFDAKIADLKEKLAKQQKMEELRQEFAKQAQEYLHWNKGVISSNSAHSFGDSLEAVEEYVNHLDKSDKEHESTSESKKKSLDDLWTEMQELGVKDNKYTTITDKDVAQLHNNLLESAKKRREAYDAELARQRAMEAKRKEYAAAAQKFADSLDSRRKEIDSLNDEPDPATLITKVEETYAGGAPEAKGLEELSTLSNEMGKMGINDNKHTSLTNDILRGRNDKLSNHVKNFISALQEEQELKEDYNTKAKALLAWISETQPKLAREFDNTLEGARKVNAEWNAYKSGVSTEKNVEKLDLHALYKSILEKLKANNRPAEFTPPEGLSLNDIDAAADAFASAEKEVADSIKAELTRQEKLASLVRTFNGDAEGLEAFVSGVEEEMQKEEKVDSLNSARLQSRLLQLTNEQVDSNKTRLEALQALQKQIAELNYHDIDTINARAEKLSSRWSALSELSSAKNEKLAVAVKEQEALEAIRVSYGQHAAAFAKYVREAVEQAKDHNFGNSLKSVTEFAAHLDSSDAEIKKHADEKHQQVASVWADIEKHNIAEPYKHSKLQQKDIESLNGQLQDALAARRKAYEAEVEKQELHEGKRKAFAEKANAFHDHLKQEKHKIEALQDGTPEERTAKVGELHNENANNEQLAELASMNEDNEKHGIFSNSHTSHSYSSLVSKNKQHTEFVKNTLAALAEEADRNARAAQQKAEGELREKIESMQIDFGLKAQALTVFLESADDIHADPTRAKDIQEIEKLIADYNKFSGQYKEQTPAHDALNKLAEALKGHGQETNIAEINNRWNASVAADSQRKSDLAKESERQKHNDALCVEFANQAKAFKSWLDERKQKSANVEGELEKQVEHLTASLAELSSGNDKVEALAQTDAKLAAAEITSNPHTDLDVTALSTEFKETVESLRKRQAVLEKDLLMKKVGDVTPEQLAEFREMFQHFDKGQKGNLVALELKGALQSLGEELTDQALASLMKELDHDGDGKINFEEFTGYMVKKVADRDSHEQILEAFLALANDKHFITEADLRQGGMTNEKIAYLLANMPKSTMSADGYDYKAWIEAAFSR